MADRHLPHARVPDQASTDSPRRNLPDGNWIAVSLVANVEAWDAMRPKPRQGLRVPQGAAVVPDLPNWAWHEHGMRFGFERAVAHRAPRAGTLFWHGGKTMDRFVGASA